MNQRGCVPFFRAYSALSRAEARSPIKRVDQGGGIEDLGVVAALPKDLLGHLHRVPGASEVGQALGPDHALQEGEGGGRFGPDEAFQGAFVEPARLAGVAQGKLGVGQVEEEVGVVRVERQGAAVRLHRLGMAAEEGAGEPEVGGGAALRLATEDIQVDPLGTLRVALQQLQAGQTVQSPGLRGLRASSSSRWRRAAAVRPARASTSARR